MQILATLLASALLAQVPTYSVWVQDSMTPVHSTDMPSGPPAVSLSLARCEVQSFQIAVRSSLPIADVKLRTAPLWNGSRSIPQSNLSWFVVGYLQTKYGELPEVLLPVSGFALPADKTVSMLVSIRAPCDAYPTDYQNALYVQTSFGALAVMVRAHIYPFAISEAGTQGALHFDARWSLSDFSPASDYQRYGDLLLQYRMSPDNIWRNGVPNPDLLERWYGMGLTGFNIYKADSAYLPAIDAFLATLAKEPHGQQLRHMASFFGYDEKPRIDLVHPESALDTMVRHGVSYTNVVGAPDLVGARANLSMLREHYPDVPVFSTAHLYIPPWKDPIGDLTHYGISTMVAEHSYYTYSDGMIVRGTLDTSLSPVRPHEYRSYYGFRADLPSPGLSARSSFWSQYQQQADGYSCNNVNRWASLSPLPAIDPSAGLFIPYTFASGNSADDLIFRGVAGPLASMRMVNIRDGMQDYEYLRLLAQRLGSIESAREMAELVSINWQRPTSPTTVRSARDAIARYLSQPSLTSHPMPAHRSTGVTSPFLSWQSDPGVLKYDVYFGYTAEAVLLANWSSQEYRGRTAAAAIRFPMIEAGHTYYWRIDALTATGVTPGYVWHFSTAP